MVHGVARHLELGDDFHDSIRDGLASNEHTCARIHEIRFLFKFPSNDQSDNNIDKKY